MQIKVEPNVELREIPLTIELSEDACLRDALLKIVPQVIDCETGEYVDDPDFRDIRLNEIPLYRLTDGLDTKMRAGDAVELEVLYHLS